MAPAASATSGRPLFQRLHHRCGVGGIVVPHPARDLGGAHRPRAVGVHRVEERRQLRVRELCRRDARTAPECAPHLLEGELARPIHVQHTQQRTRVLPTERVRERPQLGTQPGRRSRRHRRCRAAHAATATMLYAIACVHATTPSQWAGRSGSAHHSLFCAPWLPPPPPPPPPPPLRRRLTMAWRRQRPLPLPLPLLRSQLDRPRLVLPLPLPLPLFLLLAPGPRPLLLLLRAVATVLVHGHLRPSPGHA
jgi:hypothetical protein